MNRIFRSAHFKQLTPDAQQLSIATIIYNILAPIMSIFINAFIWRQFQSISTVALYNLSVFAALPIGFYINGWLLKKILPTRLLFFGTFFQALTITGLILLNSHLTSTTILAFGCLYGISTGIYFSNRHMLSIRSTQNSNRIYFAGLDVTSATIANMIVPIIIGYFIVFGTNTHTYTTTKAYHYIAILLLFTTWLLGFSIRNLSTRLPKVTKMILHKPTQRWIKIRSIAFIVGLFFGMMSFLPTLMILSFIGKEDALGTVQSAAAIITVIVLFIISKRIKPHQKTTVLAVSIIISLLGTLSFSWLYSALGVLLFVASQTLSQPLLAIAIGSFSYDTIEKESDNQFSYVLDNEVFTNLGRAIGIIILLLALQLITKDLTLKIIPVFFALTQTLLLFFVKSVEKKEKQEEEQQQLTTLYNLSSN